ncbi:MAG: phosphoribosylformylglycinamidine synthase subunit PurS [Bacteroidetes bacterium]|nr:phosphoribosylformylglycinamidine synthase subunit PurS [Bacteroidota bacterium]
MHYQVYVATERKEAILDPQGKATHHALESLGMKEVGDVRIGKFIRLDVNAASKQEAIKVAEKSSHELLANPIMETFRIVEVREVAGA